MEFKQLIPKLSTSIAVLESGASARLRRSVDHCLEAGAFWKLVHSEYMTEHFGEGGIPDTELDKWGLIIHCIALLTPKGVVSDANSAHNFKIPMGKAIFDAGVSEFRLAQLLSAPDSVRKEHLVRLCRRLLASGNNQFNLVELVFLARNNDKTKQRIADAYYKEHARQRKG